MKICVFGAASQTISDEFILPVEKLGEELAKRGHELVYGAGATGLMGAVSRGAEKAGGRVVGVVPSFFTNEEIINTKCTELIRTDTMHERKQIMEHFSDAFIITPGGAGTFEEFFEVLTLKQLDRHNKPIVIFNVNGYYDTMLKMLDEVIEKSFMKEKCKNLYPAFDNIDGVLDYIENYKQMELKNLK